MIHAQVGLTVRTGQAVARYVPHTNDTGPQGPPNVTCLLSRASDPAHFRSAPMVATLVRQIFVQPDRESTWAQLADVTSKLTEAGFTDVAVYLLDAADDILAFTAFPPEHWPKIRSNNPQERLNKEIRRRTDVVGIFPNRQAVIRLVGALLAEQTDEWAIARRYVSVESLKVPRADGPAANDPRRAIGCTAD
jgi:putative transposase